MVIQSTPSGRGRGWMSSSQGGILRRPGDVPGETAAASPVVPEVDAFLTAIQSLPVNDLSALPLALYSAVGLLEEQFNSKEALKNVIERMHERCVEDRLFAQKAAAFYGVAHNMEVEGAKLRVLLLNSIQNEFEANGHLQTANRMRFLNAVYFLCEIFNALRISDKPIAVLGDPVLTFLEQLLTGEEHEIELFGTAMAINGAALSLVKGTGLQQLLLHVRTVLMSRNISGQSRCWLLLTLDLANKDWAPLPANLQSFYQMHLGTVALTQLQRMPVSETPASPSVGEAANVPLPKSPTPVESPLQTSSVNPDAGAVSRRSSSGSDSQPQARWVNKLPGSGRLPQSKWRSDDSGGRGDWKESGARPKAWGHDDRFDKDDNYYSHSDRNDRRDRNDRSDRGSGGGRSSGNWRSGGGGGSGGGDYQQRNRRQQDTPQSPTSSTTCSSAPVFDVPKPQVPDPEESWD